jgi:CheY-like chemotaxis protein
MSGGILVVDDNDHLRTILATLLAHMGYESIFAENGEEAIKKTVSRIPELVLLDLGLPDLPGEAVVRAIKRNPTTAQIPIVGCSAYSMGEETESAFREGLAAYLQKPFRLGLFRQTIEQFVARPR